MNEKKITAKMIALMCNKSLKSSRMRNVFVMITIVLAAALLTAILMFAAGQAEQTKNELSHKQQVGYYNLNEQQVETLKKDSRIAYQVQVKTGMLSKMDGFDIMPCYISELSDEIRVGALESGRLPVAEDEIAVQAAMLKKLGVAPSVGSRVTLTFYDGVTESFLVSGILKGGETAKQFSAFFSQVYAEHGSQLKDVPYEVYAKLRQAAGMRAGACKEAMYAIGGDAGVERKYVNPSKAFIDSLSVDSQAVALSGIVGGVVLLACILVIYGVFYLSVIGRIHQFGQLRTLGMTKRQIKKLISREGTKLFLRSAPIGVAIGGIAGYFIIPDGFHIVNTLGVVAVVLVVVYGIAMLSIHKPAKIAAAVSPMEALRYVPQDGVGRAANKKLCRRLTPLGLGVMSFSKNRKKTAVTMLSLALGGILFMTAATYITSFDKENYARQGYFTDAEFHIYYADSAVENNENGISGIQAQFPLDETMVQEIATLDGVEKVEQVKSLGVRFDFAQHDEYGNNDYIYPLTEQEMGKIDKYLENGSADYNKLMSGDYVLVADNENVKESYGWEFNLGDQITLHYHDGSNIKQRTVTVLGILNNQYLIDNNMLEGWFLMPEQAVAQLAPGGSLNTRLLVSTQAEKESAVGESLRQIVAGRPELSLGTLAQRQEAYTPMINQVFGAISGLAVFIMMFSILSMMNTLITNIVTRKQELAMLESIGMGKGQIRKMLLGESLLLVLATVGVTMTIGTLCGYLLSNILYKMGSYYMAFQFPAVFALAYAGVLILVPLLITLVSLRGFSKEALVERLRGAEN